jgi:hypothetical protein
MSGVEIGWSKEVAFLNPVRSSLGPQATVIDEAETERTGVNFASHDYLASRTLFSRSHRDD